MLITKNIVVEKHARIYFSKPLEDGDEIWILFHGYAQNIDDFYNAFNQEKRKKVCFIIPEGLSKFYQKGIFGKVGASWMTIENRNNEISDQINYLNQLITDYDLSERDLNIFSFSQGVSTAARWVHQLKNKINRLVFWSANIPSEIIENSASPIWRYNPEFYYGINDKYILPEQIEDFNSKKTTGIITRYEGDHYFNNELINKYILK